MPKTTGCQHELGAFCVLVAREQHALKSENQRLRAALQHVLQIANGDDLLGEAMDWIAGYIDEQLKS